MAKKYNRSWVAKKIVIDFNQKQWRQDIGAFISEKRYWFFAKVTRSKMLDRVTNTKTFEIYNKHGVSFYITYQGQNKVVDCSDKDLVQKYFEDKNMQMNIE